MFVDWSYIQELDYEQLSFKCHHCHGYGHFTNNCKKKSEVELGKETTNQWTQVQKAGSAKQGKSKGGNAGNGSLPIEKKSINPHPEGIVTSSSNPFLVLSPSVDQISPILEEGELQQFEVHKENGEVNRGS